MYINTKGLSRVAIMKFEQVIRAERNLEKKREELNGMVMMIPEDEIEDYYEKTKQIRERLEGV